MVNSTFIIELYHLFISFFYPLLKVINTQLSKLAKNTFNWLILWTSISASLEASLSQWVFTLWYGVKVRIMVTRHHHLQEQKKQKQCSSQLPHQITNDRERRESVCWHRKQKWHKLVPVIELYSSHIVICGACVGTIFSHVKFKETPLCLSFKILIVRNVLLYVTKSFNLWVIMCSSTLFFSLFR